MFHAFRVGGGAGLNTGPAKLCDSLMTEHLLA